jgi:regulator of sigma D
VNGSITYEVLSAAFVAMTVVGGAWFFIERRIKEVEGKAQTTLDLVERDLKIDVRATTADVVLLREKMYREFVQNEQLIRLEERLVNELREVRRSLDRRFKSEDE